MLVYDLHIRKAGHLQSHGTNAMFLRGTYAVLDASNEDTDRALFVVNWSTKASFKIIPDVSQNPVHF